MENYDEQIKALRCESVINDEHPRCESCEYGVVVCHGRREDVYGCDSRRIENDAADAIERLQAENNELRARWSAATIEGFPIEDLILFAKNSIDRMMNSYKQIEEFQKMEGEPNDAIRPN